MQYYFNHLAGKEETNKTLKMNFIRYLYAIEMLLCLNASLYAQNNWTTLKEKDGIKISSRHSTASPFDDIHVELDVIGNIDQLEVILEDVGKYKEWSYATKVSRLIKSENPGKFIYYTEIEVPWPATNRYFYANFELKKNTSQRSMQIIAVNIPDYGPVPKDLVQVPLTRGTWNVNTNSNGSIHIDYVLQMNPGGSLPVWILNLFSTKGPMETFENIKKKMVVLNR